MYKLVLISKYLRRKLAPLFAASAVMLCTAMVIIVMSVMGGFLDIFRASAKNLTGDVVVEGAGLQGFTGYVDLVERIKALPGVATATPMIEAFGLVNFGDDARPIVLQGVDLSELAADRELRRHGHVGPRSARRGGGERAVGPAG